MPITCAVRTCRNNSDIINNLSYHRFPKEENLKKEWIICCGRNTTWSPKQSRICSVHFKHEDFQRDYRNELLGLPSRRFLKKTAVPTVNLGGLDQIQTEETSHKKRVTKKSNKKIDPLLASTSLGKSEHFTSKQPFDNSMITSHPVDVTTMQSSSYTVLPESDETYKKYVDLLKKYNQLKTSSRKKIEALNSRLKYYKNECHKLNKILN